MTMHDKISFTREYCRCRRIPYRFNREALVIDGSTVCFSIYNILYTEIVQMIDKEVIYNEMGFYECLVIPGFRRGLQNDKVCGRIGGVLLCQRILKQL